MNTGFDFDTNKLNKNITIASSILAILVVVSCLFLKETLFARGFFLGSLGAVLYTRLQALYVNNFSKKDTLAVFNKMLSKGRLIIIVAILALATKRTDLFSLFGVISGLISVHFLSFSIFSFYIFKKKKILVNN